MTLLACLAQVRTHGVLQMVHLICDTTDMTFEQDDGNRCQVLSDGNNSSVSMSREMVPAVPALTAEPYTIRFL